MRIRADSLDIFNTAKKAVINNRLLLEQYISTHPYFQSSLDPIEIDLSAPKLVREMMQASLKAGVGPMAAVAGGLSEVATDAMIQKGSSTAVAENGGDISIKGTLHVTLGVYAGESEIAKHMGFKVNPEEIPIGICTSSGSIGHSISFGDADAVIVFSASAYLSDAAATAIANCIKKEDPEGTIQLALEKAETIDGLNGCLVFSSELIGRTGKTPEMVKVTDPDL